MSAVAVPPVRPVPASVDLPPLQTRRIHGYDRAFRVAGSGDRAILLLHGVGDDSSTWHDVMPDLAADHLVIAPDMLGHGGSDKPRADYSVGGFANGVRDLLSVLDVDRVTMVGHSLGGGVAMQFAYQYPERCERLVLVAPGGVSREVHPMLRAATLPFAATVMAALKIPGVRWQVGTALRAAGLLNTKVGLDVDDLLRVMDALPDHSARAAFVRTLRAVVDQHGQTVTMLDRCYLTVGMPTMLVWGNRDGVIPVHHARIAHAAMPGSRLHVVKGAGHFPYRSHLHEFLGVVRDFLDATEPAQLSLDDWASLLQHGSHDPGLRRPRPVEVRA